MNIQQLACSLGASLFLVGSVFATSAAAISPYDFAGTYAMSHDGWRGTLYLGDGKADCLIPLCVSRYTDVRGRIYPVKVVVSNYRVTFYIVGLGDENADGTGGQKFEGYLMTQTKDAIAGTTWWHGRPFGFYAIKR